MSASRWSPLIVLLLVFGVACADVEGTAAEAERSDADAGVDAEAAVAPADVDPTPTVVTVHRSESCDCCGGYEEHLELAGYDVRVEMHDDVGAFKDELRVPPELRSCHTNEIEGYFAEGHVPVDALEELLERRPEVDGIALAGMPAGSPGMPGEQQAPFVVEGFTDGEASGEFGRY